MFFKSFNLDLTNFFGNEWLNIGIIDVIEVIHFADLPDYFLNREYSFVVKLIRNI